MSIEIKLIDIKLKTKTCTFQVFDTEITLEPFTSDSCPCINYIKTGAENTIKTFDDIDVEINKIIECALFLDSKVDFNAIKNEIEEVKQSANQLFTIASQ